MTGRPPDARGSLSDSPLTPTVDGGRGRVPQWSPGLTSTSPAVEARPLLLLAVPDKDRERYAVASFATASAADTRGAIEQLTRQRPSLVLIDADSEAFD